MKGTDLLYQGQAVTLEEMLQARDKRPPGSVRR